MFSFPFIFFNNLQLIKSYTFEFYINSSILPNFSFTIKHFIIIIIILCPFPFYNKAKFAILNLIQLQQYFKQPEFLFSSKLGSILLLCCTFYSNIQHLFLKLKYHYYINCAFLFRNILFFSKSAQPFPTNVPARLF